MPTISKLLLSCFIIIFASSSSNAQCTFNVNTGGFDYDLSVDLAIDNVIYTQAGTTCNVQIVVAYDVEIDTNGAQPSWWNANMYTLQGNFNCAGGSGSSFFNLPNGGGQGTVTSATFSFSSTDCSNVLLNCPITLQINAPQLNFNGPCGALSPLALPVTLKDFGFHSKPPFGTELFWETAFESNLSHFTIERSLDANSWETLDQVPAYNAPSGANYRFELPETNINQYLRLKMVDIDGKLNYSKVVYIPSKNQKLVTVYPNPARSSIHVSNVRVGDEIFVTNSLGQKLIEGSLTNSRLDVSNLNPGMYLLHVRGKDSNKFYRFVKQ